MTLVLNNLKPETERFLTEESQRRGVPVEQVAAELINRAAEVPQSEPNGTIGNTLDHLAGGWTKQDVEEFEKATAWTRRIDEEMWR